jgi:hypothetical protein
MIVDIHGGPVPHVDGAPQETFGMYHYFQPNINVVKNPLNFSRIVAGISYNANDRLRFALTSQNLIFQHSQFTFPATELQLFSPSLAAAKSKRYPKRHTKSHPSHPYEHGIQLLSSERRS